MHNRDPETFAFRCLASPSYAARIAALTSLLLCLKHVHHDVPVMYTEHLDLRLAHARLYKDVWSVILEFVTACRAVRVCTGRYRARSTVYRAARVYAGRSINLCATQ